MSDTSAILERLLSSIDEELRKNNTEQRHVSSSLLPALCGVEGGLKWARHEVVKALDEAFKEKAIMEAGQ